MLCTIEQKDGLPSARIIRPECQYEIAQPVEEGNVTTRRVLEVEMDAAVAEGLVVGCAAATGDDGEVVAVHVDL